MMHLADPATIEEGNSMQELKTSGMAGESDVRGNGRFAAQPTVRTRKRPALSAGLLDRRFDDVLKGVDEEDEAEARRSFVKWQRKEYRAVQNELVRRLDDALPDFGRTVPGKSSAGLRALGKAGRTLLHILEDTVRHMQDDKLLIAKKIMQSGPSTSGNGSAAAVPATSDVGDALQGPIDLGSLHRDALMSCADLIVLELENPWCWTIKNVGRGAWQFFRDAPFSSIVGQSLAHMMRCQDLQVQQHFYEER